MMTRTTIDELSLPRLRYIQALASASIVLAAIALVTTLIQASQSNANVAPSLILVVVAIVLNIFWLALAQRGQLMLATNGIIAMFVVAALFVPTDSTFLPIAALALVTSATLGSTEVFVVANVLVLGRIFIQTIQPMLAPVGTASTDLYSSIAPLLTLTFISGVTRYFINAGQRAAGDSRSTAALLQATADVGQIIAQGRDVDTLLDQAVNQIRSRFNHYHVQIFFINDTPDQVMLIASTGEIGKQLLERGHQLSVGSQSVVGQVVMRGSSVLVNDTNRESIYYPNELLGDTRAELALPIRDGIQIIGVLDIQSLTADAFSRADVQALQVVADLLATAIRNTRLIKERAMTDQENERLYLQTDTNLREIDRLNQQLTRVAWQSYHTEANAATGVTLENDRLTATSAWSESLMRAGQEGGQVVQDADAHKTVAVPVMLRGEVIGAIEVEAGTENRPETVEMVQAVAQRLALSLENARLYQATVEAAAQEQRINDIAARFQSVATVDELLRITLAELSETLGAEQGSIRLGRFAGQNVQNGNTSHD